ncbi:MAG: FtsH protease activity modulator HflK [Candidatus Eisenbacteria sp.]|nr:FtsH protease activity modulator HflK [Candidatus Eisenbacteria bacterium]
MDIRVRVAVLAIVLNVVLVVIKIILTKTTGSASIRADAFHSLSDVLVSVLVLIGVGLGARKRKEGIVNWAGVEHVVAIVIGLFIFYAAFAIFREAISVPTRALTNVPIAFIGLFACVIGSFLISRVEMRIGRAHDSPALIADGFHARMNMYTTIGVLVSLVGMRMGLNLDSAAAAVIALLIAVTGIEVVVSSGRGLVRGKPIEDFFVYRFIRRVILRWKGDEAGLGDVPFQIAPPRRVVILICLGILLLAWLTTAFSVAQPGQQLLVLRFGHIVREDLGPGIHVHFPWPFEQAKSVDIGKIRRIEIGFRTQATEYSLADRSYQWESRHSAGSYAKKLDESVMLTGDVNLIDINSVVQYRVSDATRFLLAAEDPDRIVRVVSEAALRQVIGNEHIDGLLTTDRRQIEDMCRVLIQSILEPYDMGLEVTTVQLQDVHPPLEAVASFRDVASAREDRSRLINEAYAYRNSVLPRARGQARKDVLGAEAGGLERVERASGEADRFLAVLSQYRRAPEVTGTRLYLEVLEEVLPGMEKFVVEPEAGEQPVDLRFYRGTRTDALGGQ